MYHILWSLNFLFFFYDYIIEAKQESVDFEGEDLSFGNGGDGDEEREQEEPRAEMHRTQDSGTEKHMPPASVMTRLILIMVWRKLIRNPNTYSSLIGLIWSLIAFRYPQ